MQLNEDNFTTLIEENEDRGLFITYHCRNISWSSSMLVLVNVLSKWYCQLKPT